MESEEPDLLGEEGAPLLLEYHLMNMEVLLFCLDKSPGEQVQLEQGLWDLLRAEGAGLFSGACAEARENMDGLAAIFWDIFRGVFSISSQFQQKFCAFFPFVISVFPFLFQFWGLVGCATR